MSRTLRSIHNEILKERLKELEKDIKKKTPEITNAFVLSSFREFIGTLNLKDRLILAWRIITKKVKNDGFNKG